MPPKSPSYQCLSCRLSQLSVKPARRHFTASASKHAKSPYKSIKATDPGLINNIPNGPVAGPVRTDSYTNKQMELLRKTYTEEQMKIIEMGEEAIPSEDMQHQALQRTDPMRIAYYDDFSTQRPILDFPHKGQSNDQQVSRMLKKQVTEQVVQKDEDALENRWMDRIIKATGLTKDAVSRFRSRVLVDKFVTNQTRMGKIRSSYCLAICGDGKGMLGIGEGKSVDYSAAKDAALGRAVRNMKPIRRYEERTIFGEVEAKVGATVVQLQSRPPGFGNRAQHLIFEMARAAGIHDIAARTPRARNKMNVVKAAYKALLSQRDPEDIARARGRKLIDVRKVYYGGSVS